MKQIAFLSAALALVACSDTTAPHGTLEFLQLSASYEHTCGLTRSGAACDISRHSVLRVCVARPGAQAVSVAPAEVAAALVATPPIRGVTTVAGDRVSCDRDANAYVLRNTLYARGRGGAGLPVDQRRRMAHLWQGRPCSSVIV